MTKKKGLSIGESLRGRMSTLQEAEESQTEDIRLQQGETEGVASPLIPRISVAEDAEPTLHDSLESFNTRLRQSTHRRLKVYSAINNRKIQDVVNEAIVAYLDRRQE